MIESKYNADLKTLFCVFSGRFDSSACPAAAESAVVGRPDDLKDSALVAFVTLRMTAKASPELCDKIRQHVVSELGPVTKPDEIRFAQALSKTRSGKIMRRLLRQIAAGTEISGDVTTLEDFNVLAKLSEDSDD